MPKSLTLRQAAKSLGVSVSAVRRKLLSKEVGADRVNGPYGEQWVLDQAVIEKLTSIFKAEGTPAKGYPPPREDHPIKTTEWTTPLLPQPEQLPQKELEKDSCSQFRAQNGLLNLERRPLQIEADGVGRDTNGSASDERTTPDQGAEQGIPLECYRETLRLLEEAHQERREAQEEARRTERQLIQLQMEVTHYQRALSENAQSLQEERAKRVEAEAKAASTLWSRFRRCFVRVDKSA